MPPDCSSSLPFDATIDGAMVISLFGFTAVAWCTLSRRTFMVSGAVTSKLSENVSLVKMA